MALAIAAAYALGTPTRWRAPRARPAPARQAASGLAPGARALPWVVLTLFAVLPPVAVWLATRPRVLFYAPAVEARYFVPFAAPAYILAAAVLAGAWRRGGAVGATLTAIVVGTALAHLPTHFADRRLRDEMQAMALAIWTQAEPGDVVVLVSGNRYPIFLYAYDLPWDRDGEPPAIAYRGTDLPPGGAADRPPVIPFPSRGSDRVGAAGWQAALEAVVATHDRVWLAAVDRHLQDPEGRVEAWLDGRLPRVLSEGYGPDALHLYARDGRPPRLTALSSAMPGLWPVGARPLALVGAPARVGLPGDRLDVTLFNTDGTLGGPDAGEGPVAPGTGDAPAAPDGMGGSARPDSAPRGAALRLEAAGGACRSGKGPSRLLRPPPRRPAAGS